MKAQFIRADLGGDADIGGERQRKPPPAAAP